MFLILEQNGEKKKVKLSLFNNFLISTLLHNVDTPNSTWFEHWSIFDFQNVFLFSRTFWTQMRATAFSLCARSWLCTKIVCFGYTNQRLWPFWENQSSLANASRQSGSRIHSKYDMMCGPRKPITRKVSTKVTAAVSLELDMRIHWAAGKSFVCNANLFAMRCVRECG